MTKMKHAWFLGTSSGIQKEGKKGEEELLSNIILGT